MKAPELKRIGRPSGWNVPYPAAPSPLELCHLQMHTFLHQHSTSPSIPDRIVEAASKQGPYGSAVAYSVQPAGH